MKRSPLFRRTKIKPVPVLLLGSEYWRRVINFDALVDEGTIYEEDLGLIDFVNSAAEAWRIIKSHDNS